MEIYNVLSYLGGYFDNDSFELDIPKIADICECTEEEVIAKLNEFAAEDAIILDGNFITLNTIKRETNKQFNTLYAPVETIEWKKGTNLILDKESIC